MLIFPWSWEFIFSGKTIYTHSESVVTTHVYPVVRRSLCFCLLFASSVFLFPVFAQGMHCVSIAININGLNFPQQDCTVHFRRLCCSHSAHVKKPQKCFFLMLSVHIYSQNLVNAHIWQIATRCGCMILLILFYTHSSSMTRDRPELLSHYFVVT